MKSADFGYPEKKKNPDQSGLIRIRIEALMSGSKYMKTAVKYKFYASPVRPRIKI
jgi:hypothetical protein